MVENEYVVGQTYIFEKNDYTPTRETGKLIFILKNSEGEPVGRTTPFDFQSKIYPERLMVIYRGEGKFEQIQSKILEEVYQVDKTYTFKVWRESGSQGYVLRDEINGLTHTNTRIPGAGQLKRFAEVECVVTSVSEQGLQLAYQSNRPLMRTSYTLESLLNTDRLRSEPWIRVIHRIKTWELLGEAHQAAERGDVRWVSMALQTLVRVIPMWLREAPGRRRIWVNRLAFVVKTVVESGAYAGAFNYNRLQLRTERYTLVRYVEQLEYIDKACELVINGKAEDMIETTLETMARGWVYQPNQRVGILMQVLALEPGLGHSHTGDVFDIIRKMRLNRDFMSIFGTAFRMMLKTYIENERNSADSLARGSLRELATAIATELLLTDDEEFELYDAHRGTLYTIAGLLTGHSGEAPIRKAMLTYCGLNDAPLEFGWEDLHDINRVCYRLMSTNRDAGVRGVAAVFEGELSRLRVDYHTMWLQPAGGEALNLRTELSGELAKGLKYAVQISDRLREKEFIDSQNLMRHRQLWNQVRSALIGKERHQPVIRRSPEEKELTINGQTDIIITGLNPEERFEFTCRSVDGRYSGVIALRDIVPYPVQCNDFRYIFTGEEDGPFALPAIAVDLMPDGRWRFSIKRAIMDINNRDACEDRNSGNTLLAKITDTSGIQYKATTEMGYGVLLSKRDTPVTLMPGNLVEVRIDSVNYRPDDWKLYVNCHFLRMLTEADDDELVQRMLPMTGWDYGAVALHDLLRESFPQIPISQIETTEEIISPEPEIVEEIYLGPEAVSNLSYLLEQCAALQRNDLRCSYTLLNLSRILADMSGDRARSDALDVLLKLLETLTTFAIDGMLDLEEAMKLIERGRRLSSTSALLRTRLKEVAVLAGLDNQNFLNRTLEWTKKGADEHIHKLIQFVTSHNALEGLGVGAIRESIRKCIHQLLALPTVESKQHRLNVNEDLYHEFKTSAIYPADNHMKPDEKRQGDIIARTVAAFLNTEGGTLYLGVGNAGNLTGLDTDFRHLNRIPVGEYDIRETQDLYNLYLQRTLRRYLGTTVDGRPLIPDYIDIQYEQVDDLWICHVTVRPFPGVVLMKPDNRLYLRRIGETVEIREPAEKRLFIERHSAR